MMLSKCCCCISLRTGCIILAILGFLNGIITFAYSKREWFTIVHVIFLLIGNGILFFGSIKKNYKVVLASLVFIGTAIVYGIVLGVITIADMDSAFPELANDCVLMENELKTLGMDCNKFKSTTTYLTVGALVFFNLVEIYFWVCIYSFFLQLKNDEPQSDPEKSTRKSERFDRVP